MANLLEIKDAQRQIGDSFALCNVNLAVAQARSSVSSVQTARAKPQPFEPRWGS